MDIDWDFSEMKCPFDQLQIYGKDMNNSVYSRLWTICNNSPLAPQIARVNRFAATFTKTNSSFGHFRLLFTFHKV